MKKLAIAGGNPEVQTELLPYKSVRGRELEQVKRVLDSGCLSGYIGAWGEAFDGGPVVKEFENAWKDKFSCKHAVAVNSATSGLYAAMGAVGVGPGDEVIVPPYTMSATAMAPLVYGGIPVFADIEPDTFCLDIKSVEKEITAKTKAILVVNLFGHPGNLRALRELADKHGIYLVEDNAQSPFATENAEYAGTIGHIGVFSLNYHKHIHTGEGGICVTNDDQLALKLRLIRNHGENAVVSAGLTDFSNMIGFNYRLPELSAAVGLAQLEKSEEHLTNRIKLANQMTAATKDMNGLTPPVVRENCTHVYYLWAMKYDQNVTGVSRDLFSKALTAEGFPNYVGYVKPLYQLPLFQSRIAMGSQGFPFNLTDRKYESGMCPIVEKMHYEQLIWFPICFYEYSDIMAKELVEALCKVHQGLDQLRALENEPSLTASGNAKI